MKHAELLEEIRALELREMRLDSSSLFEAVVTKYWLDRLTALLDKHFGPPLKPEGEWPSQQATAYADPYGGIRQNQTLYYLADEKHFYLAMLWPWMDGVCITLKLITGRCPGAPAKFSSFWNKILPSKKKR